MVFSMSQAWALRSELEFFLGEEKVAYTILYVLGVTFTGPWLSLLLVLVRNNISVPHDIIWAEMGETRIV